MKTITLILSGFIVGAIAGLYIGKRFKKQYVQVPDIPSWYPPGYPETTNTPIVMYGAYPSSDTFC